MYVLKSELSVVAFFEGVEEVGGGMNFAVVFDLVVTLEVDATAVFQSELIGGFFQILLFDKYALEGFWIEAERGAAF